VTSTQKFNVVGSFSLRLVNRSFVGIQHSARVPAMAINMKIKVAWTNVPQMQERGHASLVGSVVDGGRRSAEWTDMIKDPAFCKLLYADKGAAIASHLLRIDEAIADAEAETRQQILVSIGRGLAIAGLAAAVPIPLIYTAG